MKDRLTDRKLQSLKPKRQRYDLMDTDVPGFGVRVSEKGQRTFILIARYPGSSNPTRRALGKYPAISLEKARRRARDWRDLVEKGVDPKAHDAFLDEVSPVSAPLSAFSRLMAGYLPSALRVGLELPDIGQSE